MPLCVWCVGRRNLSTATWKSSTAHCGPCTCNCAKPPATGDCIYSFSLFATVVVAGTATLIVIDIFCGGVNGWVGGGGGGN